MQCFGSQFFNGKLDIAGTAEAGGSGRQECNSDIKDTITEKKILWDAPPGFSTTQNFIQTDLALPVKQSSRKNTA